MPHNPKKAQLIHMIHTLINQLNHLSGHHLSGHHPKQVIKPEPSIWSPSNQINKQSANQFILPPLKNQLNTQSILENCHNNYTSN